MTSTPRPRSPKETVDAAFAAALYAEGDAALDAGASLLAADAAVDAELARRGREFVRDAWTRGWQPADVVRLVARDLDGPHVRVAAELIREETARYDRLPPRWAGQLQLVDLDHGTPYRADRFSYASVVLAVLRLLVRLPRVEAVGPAPGDALIDVPHHADPRMLTRIRALLAKAEATDYPEEAEALSAKAQELMARHTVDAARLDATRPTGETPAAIRVGVEPPYEDAKAILLAAVAEANHCRAVWNGAYGFSTVVGFEGDLEAVELLHTSLLVQATTAMARGEAAQRRGGRKRTKTFRQSFLLAYATRIGTRLHDTAARTTEEAAADAPSLLPALAARDVAVTTSADRMFPRTTTSRVRGAYDEAGWTDGTTAADRAHLR
ncbi:DUF2786 domain-containing protein [Streptomyces sp. NPDC060194]|uniref:DUF2786 domain-containing protein n=1 Tax=Streptomyces sp. NPDC060194 TaxID=3347069 RepID=UPI00365BC4F4